jgi:very-short-patch-repair endonuclease
MECDGKQCGQGKRVVGSIYICPHNNLAIKFPQLAAEWDPSNEKQMCEYLPGSNRIVSWICSKNKKCFCHIWESGIHHRTKENATGCPYCLNQKICKHNNLKTLYPHLIEQWHPDNPPMDQFSPRSDKKVLWICPKNYCGDHIWWATVGDRTREDAATGCPYCINRKLCDHNNLAALYPNLKIEWHPDNLKSMNEYPPNSAEKVTWICNNNSQHIWITCISSRTRKDGTCCPFCINKTEGKLFEHLTSTYKYNIVKQKKFEWCKNQTFLPFDFCIEELKLLIELDGAQHFVQVMKWTNPLLIQQNDLYKMKCANENGYSVIRLLQEDVWANRNDWKNNLNQSIKKYDTPTNIFFGDCYDNHKVIDEIDNNDNNDLVDDVTEEVIDKTNNNKIKKTKTNKVAKQTNSLPKNKIAKVSKQTNCSPSIKSTKIKKHHMDDSISSTVIESDNDTDMDIDTDNTSSDDSQEEIKKIVKVSKKTIKETPTKKTTIKKTVKKTIVKKAPNNK